MSITALIEDAGVSLTESDATAVVSPTNNPSSTIPIEPGLVDVVTPAAITDAVATVVVDTTAEALQNEQCALHDKADELLEVQQSMEALEHIVRSTGFKGISNQTAAVLQVQMRVAQRKLGITSKLVAIENFEAKDPRQQYEHAKVSLEDIRTSAKVAKNRFLEIIEKLIAMFKKIAHNYLDGFNSVEKEAKDLEKRLSGIKSTGGEGTFKLTNAGALYQNDKLVREVTADVKGLAHFTAVAYPEAVIKFLDGVTKGVLKFDPESGGLDELNAFFEQFSKPLAFLIEQKLIDSELPGGVVLDVSESGLSVGIRSNGSYSVDPEEVEVQTTIELRRITRDLILLIAQAKDIRPEVDKIDKAGKKLIEATKRAKDKKGSDEHTATYDEMGSAVGKIVQDATPRVGEIIGYLLKYVRMQLAVVKTQADYIESNDKKED